MPDTSASRWDFPKEIWQRIIYFVPRMKDQPHYHSWTELGAINRAFKSTVEDYYLDHYVKRTEINTRSGELIDLYGGMSFSFSHFDDKEKRIAVFTDDDADKHSEKDNRSRAILFAEANRATEDPGFNMNTIVTVRRELTDMLPVDLKVDYTPGKCTYKFDWRTYYSTYFDEERAKAAVHESMKPEFDAAATRISEQVTAGKMTMEEVLTQAFKIIGPYAGEGAEGLFVPVRRKRRLRIGLKHPATKEWLESGDEERHKSFSEFDEDVVVEHIKNMRQGLSLVDFSDSDDEEGDEGDEGDEEDEADEGEEDDEEDEWEDEDEDEEKED